MTDYAPRSVQFPPYPNVLVDEGRRWQMIPVVVRYESTGTTFEIDRSEFETDVAFGAAKVSITDNAAGDFTLTVAGANRVFPVGVPIPYLATPPASTGQVATLFSVSAIAQTSVRYVLMEQQADDQLFDVSDGAADNDRYLVVLMAEFV